MSAKSLTGSLPPSLRDLVVTACPNDEDFGSSDKDKAEVVNWIQQAASGSSAKPLEPKVMLLQTHRMLKDIQTGFQRNWMHTLRQRPSLSGID